jgi:hypothetical protein
MRDKVIAGNSLTSYKAQVDIYKPGELNLFTTTGIQQFITPPTAVTHDAYWASRVQNLRDAQLITANNKTNAVTKVYQSDTGQITLDVPKKQMQIITNKSEAVVFDAQTPITIPVYLNTLSVLSSDSPALVALSVMDTSLTLAKSKRMLLVLSTDARNSNMGFVDTTNTSLININNKPAFGNLPVLIRAAKVKLAIKKGNTKTLKVYSTDLRGKRRDLIPLISQTSSKIEFELDINTLSHGATTYFEVTI